VTPLLQVAYGTPVVPPVVGDPAWGGMELVAALVCTPGHWVTYVRGGQNQHGNWWSMDSAGLAVPVGQDPFQRQGPNHTVNWLAFRV
jgi:hypothetical protein